MLVPKAFAFFKSVFLAMAYYDPLRGVFPKSTRYELAEAVVSIAHTYLIIAVPWMTPDVREQIIYARIGLTYFLWDTIVILLFNYKASASYLLHHALVIPTCIASMPSIGYYSLVPMAALYYYAECSNAFLTLWTFARKHKDTEMVGRLYNWTTPAFLATYLPYRLYFMPRAAAELMIDVWAREDFGVLQKNLLSVPLIGLVGMSFYYSYVIACIAYKRFLPYFPNKSVRDEMKYAVRPRVRVEQICGKHCEIKHPFHPEFGHGARRQ